MFRRNRWHQHINFDQPQSSCFKNSSIISVYLWKYEAVNINANVKL